MLLEAQKRQNDISRSRAHEDSSLDRAFCLVHRHRGQLQPVLHSYLGLLMTETLLTGFVALGSLSFMVWLLNLKS